MSEKIFLVSGGSSAIFQELIKEGFFSDTDILSIYNSSNKLIKKKNIRYHKINFKKKYNLKKIEKFLKNYKKIIFINFASKKTDKLFLKINIRDFLQDMKINTFSYFYFCKLIIPLMIKNDWGRIINISSTGGEKGYVGTTIYSSTKLASNGITNIIGKEYARYGITANTLKLGNFELGMFLKLNAKIKKKLLKEIPSQKTGKIINIANAINLLVESDYINSSDIYIDGGNR
jgi:NAD(P)-dependent dehydrogenase (short-subunit alcohol dehydrogenase family)